MSGILRTGLVMAVVLLGWTAAAAPEQAQSDFDAADALWEAGRYDEALARGEQILAQREAAMSLDWLGTHYLLRGNPARAEPLFLRALAIQEAALGKNHPEVAQTLAHLGNMYSAESLGLYERAEPLLLRALAIREAAFGKDHPLVAESLNDLGKLYLLQVAQYPNGHASYAHVEALLLRALAIRESPLGKSHPDVAQTLNDLALVYMAQGIPSRAEPLLLRALAIREASLGKNHPLVAELLWLLVQFYQSQGLSARAEPLFARMQAIWEAALDKNPPDVAALLMKLAGVYLNQGLLARAELLYRRALAIQEAALGKEHLLLAYTLLRLAVAYQFQGLYDRAVPLLERTLTIWEANLGKNHPFVALAVVWLGEIYMAQGLYARAEPLLQRVLTIRQAVFGEQSSQVAFALSSLGSLYLDQGFDARAEPLLQRALAIWDAGGTKNNPNAAIPLGKLGNLYGAQGNYRRAEPLLQRALAISEAAFGKNDPDVADAQQDLADLYLSQGLYAKGQPFYERALTTRGATFGKDHPRNAEALNHLAVAQLAQKRLDKALPLLTRAFTLSEKRLRQEALSFSEVNMDHFLQFLHTDEERLYALVRAHPEDANVKRLALGAALLFKGRSVEESATLSRVIYQSLGAQDRDTLERLKGLRTQLAQLSLQGPGSSSPADFQHHLEELSAQSAALEAELAQRSAPLRALTALPPPEEIVARVAAALPKDAALVEFITYVDRPLTPRPGSPKAQRPSTLRYLALVLLPDSTIGFKDLGPAEPIELAALHLRDALANRDADFQGSAQALYRLAFQPLLPLLGTKHRLFLATDGQLSLVPFAALHDGEHFLVDSFDFTYLPSGKNLLPRPEETKPPGSVVVLADPDFKAPLPNPTSSVVAASTSAERSASVERFFSTLGEDVAQRAWSAVPLPGTRQEAEAIHRLLPQAQLFLGSEATKERLLRLPTPGVLHLATHGFFLEDAPVLRGSRAAVTFGEMGEKARARSLSDPLLRSGLILAGAHALPAPGSRASSTPESSLVTALELAGLNLWGTQLVVLSACDTGRGDVKLGQGVYGLRRAFLVAGAETVVMSLWKVNDDTTRTLMESYYRNLLAGQGRATAMREAMQELRRTQPHPYYWAPFIAMGQDTPLRL